MGTYAHNAADCRRMLRRALGMLLLSLVLAGVGGGVPAHGQGISREYPIKAAFLYKFATYVRWPGGAFADAESPFVIGILGPDPVGPYLRRIAAVKEIDGRRIEIRNFQQAEDVDHCHILFMSQALPGETQQAALQRLTGRNILFVGEIQEFLKHGGVIDFVVRENRTVFYISQSACQREGLVVSAQLLKVAEVMN